MAQNIGKQGQRKRLLSGVVPFLVGIGGGVTVVVSDLSRWWRLLLFFPFWGAALGAFQALEKT